MNKPITLMDIVELADHYEMAAANPITSRNRMDGLTRYLLDRLSRSGCAGVISSSGLKYTVNRFGYLRVEK